jgi:mannose-6-phosphate isomerase class I/N-acetylglucosamine kinase-like BadF-type ATPase
MGKYFLGIDGGGTKTAFSVMEEGGKIVASSLAEATSIDTVSLEETESRLLSGIKTLDFHGDYAAIYACLGGIASSADEARIREILRRVPGSKENTFVVAKNDAVNAYRSCFEKEGIVLIVGTGSVVMGKSKKGRFLRLGGYGFKEGDRGSGYYLGMRALQELAKYYDGRKKRNDFITALEKKLSISSKEGLIAVFNTYGRTQIAALAPIVAASRNHPDAKKILREGAAEYASLVSLLAKKLSLSKTSYAIVGGIGSKTIYRDDIEKAIEKTNPLLKRTEPFCDPVYASCLLARETYESSFVVNLIPSFVERIWGGERLASFPGCALKEKIGEAWVLSGMKNGASILKGGAFEGISLDKAFEEMPRFFFPKESGAEFPLLIKLIDAKEDLSVQVHENNEEAKLLGGKGKTECWFILDCPQNGTLVAGLNGTSKDEVKEAIASKKWSNLLRLVPIEPNDFVFIKPGTVHAIKKGTFLLEIQQPSDTTYRLYDYDRTDINGQKRELHLDKALQVLDMESKPTPAKNSFGTLTDNAYFYVKRFLIEGSLCLDCSQGFVFVYVISGSLRVEGKIQARGDFFLLSSLKAFYELQGGAEVIIAGAKISAKSRFIHR